MGGGSGSAGFADSGSAKADRIIGGSSASRLTAISSLMLWFVISLLMLPTHDHAQRGTGSSSPWGAVPMALLVINVFWHFRLGLQVVVEDYVHGGMRIVTLALIHLWTFGMGAFALFAIFKIAFTGAPA